MADSVTHAQGASPGGTLQEYIGYPGAIDDKGSTSISDLYKKDMDEKIVIATLAPLSQKINKDANIYDVEPAWGKYVTDLDKNCAVKTNTSSQCLKVVISQFPPVTETYTNEYGDSEIFSTANMIGGKAAELMQIAGIRNMDDLQEKLQNNDSTAAKAVNALVKMWNGASDKLRDYSDNNDSSLGSVAGAIGKVMKNPWSKIGWPQMWKNCSYQSTYELSTRLYCYNVTDDTEYNNNIKAALAALQMFVAPKSEDGVLYTWPYMMEFEIPGSVYMPVAYCSNMSVIKGGDVADFSFTGRPNIVDVRMTIQNAYSICVNMPYSKESLVPTRPTLYKDQKALSAGRNIGISPASSGGGGGGSSSSASSAGQNLTASSLSSSALSYVRSNTTPEQKAAIAKLAGASAGASGGPVAAVAATAATNAVLGS